MGIFPDTTAILNLTIPPSSRLARRPAGVMGSRPGSVGSGSGTLSRSGSLSGSMSVKYGQESLLSSTSSSLEMRRAYGSSVADSVCGTDIRTDMDMGKDSSISSQSLRGSTDCGSRDGDSNGSKNSVDCKDTQRLTSVQLTLPPIPAVASPISSPASSSRSPGPSDISNSAPESGAPSAPESLLGAGSRSESPPSTPQTLQVSRVVCPAGQPYGLGFYQYEDGVAIKPDGAENSNDSDDQERPYRPEDFVSTGTATPVVLRSPPCRPNVVSISPSATSPSSISSPPADNCLLPANQPTARSSPASGSGAGPNLRRSSTAHATLSSLEAGNAAVQRRRARFGYLDSPRPMSMIQWPSPPANVSGRQESKRMESGVELSRDLSVEEKETETEGTDVANSEAPDKQSPSPRPPAALPTVLQAGRVPHLQHLRVKDPELALSSSNDSLSRSLSRTRSRTSTQSAILPSNSYRPLPRHIPRSSLDVYDAQRVESLTPPLWTNRVLNPQEQAPFCSSDSAAAQGSPHTDCVIPRPPGPAPERSASAASRFLRHARSVSTASAASVMSAVSGTSGMGVSVAERVVGDESRGPAALDSSRSGSGFWSGSGSRSESGSRQGHGHGRKQSSGTGSGSGWSLGFPGFSRFGSSKKSSHGTHHSTRSTNTSTNKNKKSASPVPGTAKTASSSLWRQSSPPAPAFAPELRPEPDPDESFRQFNPLRLHPLQVPPRTSSLASPESIGSARLRAHLDALDRVGGYSITTCAAAGTGTGSGSGARSGRDRDRDRNRDGLRSLQRGGSRRAGSGGGWFKKKG